ncbi:MAG: glycosyltransferase family 2 protein [Bacteroidia bacterium]
MNFDKNIFPKISIVTPSFNQGEFLEETILSVLEQNYPNLEYIIIDGGSTDNSVEIIKKYEKKLAYWVSEKDRGQSHAINKGLQKCTGEIFNWLNSDDCYLSNTLRKVAEGFANKNTFLLCGKSNLFKINSENLIAEGTFFDPNDFAKTLAVLHIEQPSTFFRMSAVKKMGELSERLHFVMDKEWWLTYLLNFGTGNSVKTNTVFVNFRYHKKSKTVLHSDQFYNEHASILHSIALQKNKNEYAKLLEIKYNILKNYKFDAEGLTDELFDRMIRYFLLKRGYLIFEKKDFEHAQKMMKIIAFEDLNLDEQEKRQFKKMKKQIRFTSWLLFRINRKINFIFKNSNL